MKITQRMGLSVPSFVLGLAVALGASVFASEPAPTQPVNTVTCGFYEQVGDTFDCTTVDADGVESVETFLVSVDDDNNHIHTLVVPVDSVVQPEGNEISSDSTSSDSTTDDSSILLASSDTVDGTPDTGSSVVPDASEVVVEVETEEGVDDAGIWESFTTKAVLLYDTTSTTLVDKYHEMFPVEGTVVEKPSEVLQPEAEEPVVPVVEEEAATPPLGDTVDEAEVVVVAELPLWQQYANDLYGQEDSHLVFESEAHWLAMNMVFEARNQGDVGTNAVADVTVMRLSTRYRGEGTVYDLVTARKQFSWHGDAVPDVLTMAELAQFSNVVDKARELLTDYMTGQWQPYLCDGEGATHYHTVDITPDWQSSMDKDCGIIGDHHFWTGK